jgi:hypothetical protein
VNELPPSSRFVARAGEPVTDADRSEINARLNDAFSAGTIDEETFHRDLDTLYAAGTLGDLAPVVAGLPARAAYEVPQIIEQNKQSNPPPGELAPARSMSPAMTAGLVGGVAVLVVLLIVLAIVIL